MKNQLFNPTVEALKLSLCKHFAEMPLPAFKEFVHNYCFFNLGPEDIKSIVSDLNFIIEDKEN